MHADAFILQCKWLASIIIRQKQSVLKVKSPKLSFNSYLYEKFIKGQTIRLLWSGEDC